MLLSKLAPGQRQASQTAISVALLRAIHETYDASPKLHHDPVAPLLVGSEMMQRAKAAPEWMQSDLTVSIRSHVVLRSRYAEDQLWAAASRGLRQYVILGAGYDTFAYRQPAWAASLGIFEVDHVASQQAKLERLRSVGIPISRNVTFVAADFESATLRETLAKGGVDIELPTFFACLGVMVYLPKEVVDAIFRMVASFPRGSQMVFTFSQGQSSAGLSAMTKEAAAVGEPFRTFHDPDTLYRDLLRIGYSRVAILQPEEAAELYYSGTGSTLPPPRRAAIACVYV
jgi:methyltransferase (TIGR00027 family)